MKYEIFQVGELAFLQNVPSPLSFLNGAECEVVGALAPRNTVDLLGNRGVSIGYVIKQNGLLCCALPYMLKRKPAPSTTKDTEFGKTVDWSDCAWNPNELVGA